MFAMKNHMKNRLYVLKMIKAKILEFKTAKGYKEGDYNEAKEVQLLQKMEKEWTDERNSLEQANRDIEEISAQINIKNTKLISEFVKSKYPAADNKTIVKCIKEYE